MKKGIPLLILLIIVVALFLVFLQSLKGKILSDFTRKLPAIAEPQIPRVPTVTEANITKSLFVPYWSMNGEEIATDGYDTALYFGITSDSEGIDSDEPGYKKLAEFQQYTSQAKKLLVLRIVDREQALQVLKSPALQEKIIAEAIAVAKQYDFSGIVLDLELAALPFDSLLKQVTSFASDLSEETMDSDLDFSMTLYGDTFYRLRPFDVKELSKHVPSFLIMAYDFHKAGGNPGPNFPLSGKDIYGYDFETMIGNFLQNVSAEKLSIIFGMYGYDWEVDGNGKAKGQGVGKSYLEIKKQIIDRCQELDCSISRNKLSSETKIIYTGEDATKHIVWLEDSESVKQKEAVARRMGIGKFSFWAYSYF